MADESPNPEKKIIVDEDWKSQVEAEKAAASKQEASPKQPPREQALPPPDLTFLASSLYLQAMMALGLLPDPRADNKTVVQPVLAKHTIDTLEMLFEKTEGHRTPDETAAIDNMLYELRMAYISTQGTGGGQG